MTSVGIQESSKDGCLTTTSIAKAYWLNHKQGTVYLVSKKSPLNLEEHPALAVDLKTSAAIRELIIHDELGISKT